jgi:hypothetical protein
LHEVIPRGDEHRFGVIEIVGMRKPPGQSEIHHLDVAVFGEHHVRGLEVAVHHTPPVGRVERFGDLVGHAHGISEWQRPTAEPAFE